MCRSTCLRCRRCHCKLLLQGPLTLSLLYNQAALRWARFDEGCAALELERRGLWWALDTSSAGLGSLATLGGLSMWVGSGATDRVLLD